MKKVGVGRESGRVKFRLCIGRGEEDWAFVRVARKSGKDA